MPASESTSVATVTPETPQATPTGESVGANLEDPATWIIGSDSVGPFVVGRDFEEAASVMVDHGWTRGCTGTGDDRENLPVLSSPSTAVGTRSIIVAARYDETSGDRFSDIGTISLTGDAALLPRSADDLGIGSSLAQAQSLLPHATVVSSFGQGYHGLVDTVGAVSSYLAAREGDTIAAIDLTVQSTPPMEFCG